MSAGTTAPLRAKPHLGRLFGGQLFNFFFSAYLDSRVPWIPEQVCHCRQEVALREAVPQQRTQHPVVPLPHRLPELACGQAQEGQDDGHRRHEAVCLLCTLAECKCKGAACGRRRQAWHVCTAGTCRAAQDPPDRPAGWPAREHSAARHSTAMRSGAARTATTMHDGTLGALAPGQARSFRPCRHACVSLAAAGHRHASPMHAPPGTTSTDLAGPPLQALCAVHEGNALLGHGGRVKGPAPGG